MIRAWTAPTLTSCFISGSGSALVAVVSIEGPNWQAGCRQGGLDHFAAQRQLETLRGGSLYATRVNCEQGHWLLPIEDRRDQNGNGLVGLIRGVSLSGYLQLVESPDSTG